MDITQISQIIKDVLSNAGLYSDNAFNLILGTGAQESRYKYLRQLGDGPARSFWQVEPATAYDNFKNYLAFRPGLALRVFESCFVSRNFMERAMQCPVKEAHIVLGQLLERNIAFAILMARIRYHRVPEEIPDSLDGLARYWKSYYNTNLGAGTVEEFKENYNSICRFSG